MNGIKLGIVVVVAVVVGALGGGVFARQQLTSQLTQLAHERDMAQQESAKQVVALRDTEQQLSTAQAALKARDSELERMQAANEKLASAPPAPPAAEQAVEETTPPPAPEPERRSRRFGDAGPGAGGQNANQPPEMAPGDRANFSMRMRERMDGYIDSETAKTNDPVVQQRLTTLKEQSDYMLELMQKMRDTMDEKERAEAQQEFAQVRGTVTGLVQEQQDYMLQQLATQNGITDPQKQQAFINSLRETQASPFFSSPMMSFGGRRGGGQGGFGGFGGGGPRQ